MPLSGWSLQSVLTGVRLYLPNAAPVFSLGNINEVAPVYLAPGEQAIISSSVSPVSVSFRENMCTGYLGQYQAFTPQLSRQCPSPQTELPMTPSNFAAYGDSCFDTLESLYACTFPDVLPQSVSPECAAALRNTLSYTSCVVRHRSDPGFNSSTWRLFLGSPVEVWRNSHDTIRLLDAQGRTVDVYSY